MLYLVHMIIEIPNDADPQKIAEIKATEKAYSQSLQRDGRWQHIWRVVGEYANYSVFDVPGNEELHDLLSKLPLFPYMKIEVTPLCRHPSAI
jgi:muconolactone D-isomerase